MVEGHDVSADGLKWRMKLRDALKFHDGTPVRSANCIASVSRWMKRDGFGQRLEASLNEIKAIDDRTFEFQLKRRWGSPRPMSASSCPSGWRAPTRISRSTTIPGPGPTTVSGARNFPRSGG